MHTRAFLIGLGANLCAAPLAWWLTSNPYVVLTICGVGAILAIGGAFCLTLYRIRWVGGVTRVYMRRRDAHPRIASLVESSLHVDILCVNATRLITEDGSPIPEAIRARNSASDPRKNLRLLMASPESDWLATRARLLGENAEKYRRHATRSLEKLREIMRESRANVQTRLYTDKAIFNIFIFDHCVLVGFYQDGRPAVDSKTYEIQRYSDLGAALMLYFDYVWSKSVEPSATTSSDWSGPSQNPL